MSDFQTMWKTDRDNLTMFVALCHTLFGVKDAFVFAVDSSFLMIFGTKIQSQIGTSKTAFFDFFFDTKILSIMNDFSLTSRHF